LSLNSSLETLQRRSVGDARHRTGICLLLAITEQRELTSNVKIGLSANPSFGVSVKKIVPQTTGLMTASTVTIACTIL
jgi:hypothetical protein